MAEIKWIKIKTDIFSDEKVLLIEQMPDADSLLVIWFKLLCMAGKENNYGVFLMRNRMPYTEEMLATIFRRPLNTVRLALSTFEAFGMIDIEDDIISIPNWEKHQNIEGMERIREQTRKRVAKHREKQKLALLESQNGEDKTGENVTVTLPNATDKKRIDKKEDKDNIKKKINKKESTHDMFNRLLPDYIISDDLKSKIIEWLTYKQERKDTYQEQGMKSLLRQLETNATQYGDMAVCEVIDESMSNNWKGIIFDRLKQRKEIVPDWMQKKKSKSFNNDSQRKYDFNSLEKELLDTKKTVDNDPELAARAETLKRVLGGV